jgi:hypothetical protein
MSKEKVLVVLCPRDEPNMHSFLSLCSACFIAGQEGILTQGNLILDGVPGFHNANKALANFMYSDCTHLFMGADDIQYPGFIIPRLIALDKPMVGGVYLRRDNQTAIALFDPAKHDEYLEQGAVVSVPFVGGHTMMIQRGMVEIMIKSYPELVYSNPHTGVKEWALFLPFIYQDQMLLDDWAFSQRARNCGFSIYQDFMSQCTHLTKSFVGFNHGDQSGRVVDADQRHSLDFGKYARP